MGTRDQNLGAFAGSSAAQPPPKPEAEARPGFLKWAIGGAASLLNGMRITLSTLLNPKKVVTQQYPENRETLKFPERFRGSVYMPHDENDENNCTACTLCEKACPNGTISILPTKNIAGKKVLGQYVYRYDQCTLCNLCIEACPFDAIRMDHEFEAATTQKGGLVMILNKKEGRG